MVLWFEHDLYDQLQLVDALALAAPDGTPELVVVGSFPGRPGFRGLGELTADELETLWPGRVPASQDTLAAAVSAWAAVRHPDPSALAAAAGADLPGLPFLRPALLRLLEELPAPGDGLSGTERRALQAIAAGAATPAAAFLAEQDLEAAPFLGDAWFFRGARRPRVPGPAGRDAGRRPAAAASAAGRRPRVRPAAAPADRRRRAGPGRPAGPGCAAGPGPLAGRHAPHPGRRLALGPRRPPPDRARPVTARARARRPPRPGYR